MWNHQSKPVTQVYVTRSESAQYDDALMRQIAYFRCKSCTPGFAWWLHIS